uniref:Uncharacterized protein n=1 Tax=Physcomitrium patens TaxID=3218 RepID=A0A2K1JZM4_PHYPA|nr:hypothetical protein PHYPA_014095 [Physcomitrium patens]
MSLNRVSSRLSTSLVLGRCIDMEDFNYDFILHRVHIQYETESIYSLPCMS